jgi:hypothetical protein
MAVADLHGSGGALKRIPVRAAPLGAVRPDTAAAAGITH